MELSREQTLVDFNEQNCQTGGTEGPFYQQVPQALEKITTCAVWVSFTWQNFAVILVYRRALS